MRRVLDVRRLVASAFVVLFGQRGQISEEARCRRQSRQSIYRESDKLIAAVEGRQAQARIEQLQRQLQEQSAQLEQLREGLDQAVEITADRQAEFAATGQAEGVSLPVLRRLLEVFLGPQAPSVATLGRGTAEAGRRAAQLLEVLDEVARPRVRELAADEIFF